MGWRGEDRVTGVKNDSAVLGVSGKKMSGEKAISMIQGKDSKWYPLSLGIWGFWTNGDTRPGMCSFDSGDCVHPLANFSSHVPKVTEKGI